MTARRWGLFAVFTALLVAASLLAAPGAGAGPGKGKARGLGERCGGRPATIVGTAGDDVITGTPKRDVIVAKAGNDVIDSLDGNDVVCGGEGHDLILTGAGNDWAWGDEGEDRMEGGSGNDRLFGGADDDDLDGGEGKNRLDGGPGDDDNCINGHKVENCERSDEGGTPGIAVDKNDPGPDVAPAVPAGVDSFFDIVVFNTGDTDLVDITVADPVAPDCEQAVPDLAPGASHSFSCTAPTDLTTPEIANEITVSGKSPAGEVVSASDSSTVPVLIPALALIKRTNGADTDVDPVPEITEGEPVEWTYEVENTGEGDLSGLVVDDPDLPAGVSISCPATDLPAGGSVTCTASDVAAAGPYANTATASADNDGGLTVSDSDSSAYEGIPATITGSGVVIFTNGGGVAGADITASFEGGPAAAATTAFGGGYEVEAEGLAEGFFRVDVATDVGGVPLSSTRYGFVPAGSDTVALDPIELPDPAASQLFPLGGGEFGDFDEVRVLGLPPEVVSVYGEAFDEETEPNAFPGLVGDDSSDPFNSTVFAWLVALDGAGNEVTSFPAPVTVRLRIPRNQHADVFDLTPGNGVIDVPMYSFDDAAGDWVVEATGIVTNSVGTPFAEADAAAIRAGSFFSVWVQYETDHFSWWNLDYKKSDFPGSEEPDFFDFGDAGGTYPTLLADDGARHDDPNRLWLGQWADQETDANVVDADDFDDGLLSFDPISVRVNNWDIPGDIYLNVLIDRNDDGDWADPGEWAVQNAVTGTPVFKGASFDTTESWDPVTEGALRLTVTTVSLTAYDGTGSFALGETEDYLDPPDGDLAVSVRGGGAVTSDVGGIDCPATLCNTTVVGGSVVTLTATPDPNREFLGWSGDCFDRGTNPTCAVAVGPNDFRFASASFSEKLERVFSLAPGSPTLAANGWSAADILFIDEDAGVVTRLFSTTDLGLDPADDIDALDFFFEGPPPPITASDFVGTEYSATESSAGEPGSQVEAEAGCAAGDLGGDVWGLGGEGGGGEFGTFAAVDPFQPFQWVDEDGVMCGTNQPFAAAGLVPGDEIDGWSRIDLAFPGDPYYSLAPGSPTLGILGASEADILETEAGVVQLFLPAADLSLVAGDDVDALAGDIGAGGGDFVQLSLAPGSPTLASNGWNAAMVLASDGFGLFVLFDESELGLLTTDDLDALEQNGFFFGEPT